jgi:hypothetical protein
MSLISLLLILIFLKLRRWFSTQYYSLTSLRPLSIYLATLDYKVVGHFLFSFLILLMY